MDGLMDGWVHNGRPAMFHSLLAQLLPSPKASVLQDEDIHNP